MLTSPAENHPLLRALGENSAECERRGADFLIIGKDGLTAVQRKAIPDLVASLYDNRLARELRQMAEATDLVHAFLLIEGHYNQGWETRAQLDGILMAAQLEHGVGVMWTQTVAETADTLRRMETWLTKGTHGSLMGRRASPKRDDGGKSWREHVWMTIDGISVAWARKLDDYFEGKLPIMYTCDWDAVKIKGLGPVKRKALREAWGGTDGT